MQLVDEISMFIFYHIWSIYMHVFELHVTEQTNHNDDTMAMAKCFL